MHEGWNDATGGDGEQPLPGGAQVSEPVPDGAVSSMLAALAQITALAEEVLVSPLWQHSGPQSVEAVRASAVAMRKVQAAHLAAVADMDARPGVLEDTPLNYSARAFLQGVLHRTRGQAKLDVSAARALKPDADPSLRGLPRLGVAFAAGEVSREHVDVAVRAVAALPKDLLPAPMADENGDPLLDENGKAMCAGDVVDERLTAFAKDHDSYALSQLAKQLKDAVDPDGSFDPDQCLRRGARSWWDAAGMFHLRGEFDPAAGAFLESMLDQLSSPRRYQGETADGETLDVADPRDPKQRKADAVLEMARAAQASGRLGTRGGESPRINLTTRPEDLAAARAADATRRAHAAGQCGCSDPKSGPGSAFTPPRTDCRGSRFEGDGGCLGTGTHIGPGLLARLSCDAVLERALLSPSGAILDLGRDVRTVTPAQRRALTARDGGCIVPGCTIPAAWCEAHHVQFWSAGGRSDIDNYALLCLQHHTETHTGMWTIRIRDGVPWVIPPDWIDVQQRPTRNRYHQQVQEVRDLGAQLRLGLDGDSQITLPSDRPPPPDPEPQSGAHSNPDHETGDGRSTPPVG